MEHLIPITNGKGSKELANGTYNVVANISGYDNASVDPAQIEITEGVNEYSLTIAATGTLTLHVSDDGTDIGIPIVGASFMRCDAEGTTYGEAKVSDDDGNVVFDAVPYHETEAPNIYYKQIGSDGEHTFDDTLQTTTMDSDTKTIEVENPIAAERTFTITDANYENLFIENGQINLNM